MNIVKDFVFAIGLMAMTLPLSADVPVPFGGAGFTWTHSGLATPNHIWVTGDSWDQTASTTLPSATSLALNLTFNDNTMAESLDINVDVNGTVVGSFIINPGEGAYSNTYEFAPIAGTNYDIRLVATNTISAGRGAVSLLADGSTSTATLSAVPEPASLALLGTAAGLVLLLKRRRARA